jgi:hypothetical protein
MTREDAVRALSAVIDIVVETIEKSGSNGMPGGHLYAVLMGYGCTLDQFEYLMRALVETKKIRRRGQLYFAAK